MPSRFPSVLLGSGLHIVFKLAAAPGREIEIYLRSFGQIDRR
jgi:hypothetical protein